MTERIRVLHVTSRLNVGGLARLVLTVCDRLDRSRFEPLLATGRVSEAEGDMLQVESDSGRDVRFIRQLGRNPSPVHDFAALRALHQLIREFRPAVVHTHAAKAGALGRMAAAAAGVPVRVHSYHGHVFSGYFSPFVSTAIVNVERGLARITTAIVVPGESQAREIIEKYRIARRTKVHVIPYGIDTDRYAALPLDRQAARFQFGLPPTARVIGAVGRMAVVKNHSLLIDAFERVAADPACADVHLLIVGGGECRPEIENRVGRSRARSRIHLAGWVKDLRDAYTAIDVLALTSLNEGMPVAVMEAMASNLPVVCTPAGGVVDLITPDDDGIVVRGWDPEEFSAALTALLADDDRMHRIGARARARVTATHSDAIHVHRLEEFYLRLLATTQ